MPTTGKPFEQQLPGEQESAGDDLTIPNVGLRPERMPVEGEETIPKLVDKERPVMDGLEAGKGEKTVEDFNAETERIKARAKDLRKEKNWENPANIIELKWLDDEIERRRPSREESKMRRAISLEISALEKKIRKGEDVGNNEKLKLEKEQALLQADLARIERYEKEKEAEKKAAEEKLKLETAEREMQEREKMALEILQDDYVMDRNPADREKAFADLTEGRFGTRRSLREEATGMTDKNFTKRRRAIIRTDFEEQEFVTVATQEEKTKIQQEDHDDASLIFWQRNLQVPEMQQKEYMDGIRKKLGLESSDGEIVIDWLVHNGYIVEECKTSLLASGKVKIPKQGGKVLEFDKIFLGEVAQEERGRQLREAKKRAGQLATEQKKATLLEDRMSEVSLITDTVREYRINKGDLLVIRGKDIVDASIGDLVKLLESSPNLLGSQGKEIKSEEVIGAMKSSVEEIPKMIPNNLDARGTKDLKAKLFERDPLLQKIPRTGGLRMRVIELIFNPPAETSVAKKKK